MQLLQSKIVSPPPPQMFPCDYMCSLPSPGSAEQAQSHPLTKQEAEPLAGGGDNPLASGSCTSRLGRGSSRDAHRCLSHALPLQEA